MTTLYPRNTTRRRAYALTLDALLRFDRPVLPELVGTAKTGPEIVAEAIHHLDPDLNDRSIPPTTEPHFVARRLRLVAEAHDDTRLGELLLIVADTIAPKERTA